MNVILVRITAVTVAYSRIKVSFGDLQSASSITSFTKHTFKETTSPIAQTTTASTTQATTTTPMTTKTTTTTKATTTTTTTTTTAQNGQCGSDLSQEEKDYCKVRNILFDQLLMLNVIISYNL